MLHRPTTAAQTARTVLVALLALLTFSAALLLDPTDAAAAPANDEWAFLDLINADRSAAGLGPLQMVTSVSDIAEEWSWSMIQAGRLSHRGDLASRVSAVAPNWSRLGENVGVGGSVSALHTAFMNSSGHRANILGQYNYVGIGVLVSGGQMWVTVNFLQHSTALPVASRYPVAPPSVVSPLRPDGVLTSSPDLWAVRGTTRMDAVVVGSDGGVYWTGNGGSGFGNWAGLGAPPSGVQGDPSIVSWSVGRLDVFVRGGDNRLWQRFSTNGGASWSGWMMPLGPSGSLASSPEVVSWAPGRLDIVVRGTDGRVYQQFYENGWAANWIDMGAPSGGIQDAPAAVSWSPGRLDLFVRGADNRLWQRFWDGTRWSIWVKPIGDNGTLSSAPSATSGAHGRIDIAVRGSDNGLYILTYAGAWSGWGRLGTAGDVIQGRPSAASPGGSTLRVAGRGSDNKAYIFNRS